MLRDDVRAAKYTDGLMIPLVEAKQEWLDKPYFISTHG